MIQTATQLAERLQRITKSMHPDILAMWVEDILNEVLERILNTKGACGDDIIDIVSDIKEEINK